MTSEIADAETRLFGVPHLTIRGKIIVFTRDQDGLWQPVGKRSGRGNQKRVADEEEIEKATDPMDMKRITDVLDRPMAYDTISRKACMSAKAVRRLIPRMIRDGRARQIMVKGALGHEYLRFELT